MIPPANPPDEERRLASLRSLNLLDTAAEERFDRITRLAQTLFDVPIALISLVDADRQWFKSRQGLDAEQTAREISFCGHAILGADLFEIPDASRDERFRDNPLVVGGPKLLFYAGAPLSAPDGRKIGTLCLADRKPRALTDAQKWALKDLAALADRELAESVPASKSPEAAKVEAARRTSRDRLVAAGFAAVIVLMLTAAFASYRGVRALVADVQRIETAGAVQPSPELAAAVDADTRFLVIVASAARGVGATVVLLVFLAFRRYRRERAEAESALVSARDSAVRDAGARRQAQEENRRLNDRLRAVLDHLDSGVALVEAGGSISLYNLAAERIHGTWRGELERVWREGAHPPLRPDGKTPLTPDEDPLLRAFKGETVRDARVFLRTPFRPNGYTLVLSAAPMRSPDGLVTGALLVFREAMPA